MRNRLLRAFSESKKIDVFLKPNPALYQRKAVRHALSAKAHASAPNILDKGHKHMSKLISNGARHFAATLGALFLLMAFAGSVGVSLFNSPTAAAVVPQGTPTPSPTSSPTPSPTASPTPNFEHCQISLSAPTFAVGEGGGQVVVGVNRVCDRVRDSKVDFFTQSRSASSGADFTRTFGRIDFADGETNRTITIPILEDALAEGTESFVLFLTDPGGSASLRTPNSAVITITDDDGTPGPTPTPSPAPSASPTPSPSPTPDFEHCQISLNSSTLSIGEGAGRLSVTVNRVCDRVRDSKVDFFTRSGTASDRSDFTFAAGRLFFAPGETSKTLNLLITDDSLVEGNETFNLFLTDPGGSASLSFPNSAVVTIVDNDSVPASTNPIEQPDFFVQQHYSDFLSRQADHSGLEYWSGRINECGGNEDCIRDRRIGVSAAFFIEQEFQDTGNFVYRLYQASYGRKPMYAEFMPDRGRVVASSDLAANKVTFTDDWVTRPEFTQVYPESLTAFDFVNRLMDHAGLPGHEVERERLQHEMESGKTRSQVLRDVIEIQDFRDREYNKAFVLMEYFGYLRRDPDANGYNFWVNVVNGTANNYRGMVCAFITSAELQDRFSSIRTRSDAECNH